jgi:protein-tyrosine-phosphatase
MAAWADLVVVMDSTQRQVVVRDFGVPSRKVLILADLDPEPSGRREIPDPLGHPLDVFQESYDRVDRCLTELLGIIQR